MNELVTGNPQSHARRPAEVKQEKKLTGQTPSAAAVSVWVESVKVLPPKLAH